MTNKTPHTFPCTKCGACCRNVAHLGLPTKPGTTHCQALGEDNTCQIYESRPMICRVDLIYEQMFKDIMTKEKFYAETTKACEILQTDEVASAGDKPK